MMSPRNMLLAGIVLVLLNVAALAPMATGAVEGAVEDNFASFSKDSVCANDDCTEAEEDWASSTSPRDFYGYSITNVADVMASGATPVYEKIGPVTYDITTTRTILDYDSAAGELTYNSVKSFACSADTAVPCDTEVSQLNIAFQTQVIGATGTAIAGIMDLTKVGFAVQMVLQDMNTTQAGIGTASSLGSMLDSSGQLDPNGMYMAWSGSDTGAGITAMNAAENVTLQAADFSAGINDALYDTMHPLDPDFNISLLQPLGVVAFVGMGEPEYTVSSIEADPLNSTTMQRAVTYGYAQPVMVDATTPMMVDLDGDGTAETVVIDYNQTLVRDWSLYAGIGQLFAGHGGGTDANLTDNDDLQTRLRTLTGVDMTGVNAVGLMIDGHMTDTPAGIVATNAEGTSFGMVTFLGMEAADVMTAYNMTVEQYGAVAGWVAGWATSASSAQLGLLGGVGTMNAEQFVNQTFGAASPVGDPYLENSLNMGGAWSALFGNEPVDLTQEQSANVLYGPLGLTTRTGASIFLYGELSGMTPPIDFATMGPGTPMVWDATTIGALYGVDTNAATAMRALMMGPLYGTTADSFVPGFLMSSFGTAPYLTQSFNNWLLGWHDPVSAFLATGNPADTSVGWTSLESNETYFSSEVLNGGVAIANGDGTNYTMCTGEVETCDKGETLAEDGSTQLSWRNDAMMAATFGLITPESLVGTTGGFLTGTGDKVDVSGYAIADITCDGTSEVKGIPVDDCSATVVATERNIQANLLETYSLLDATPGALPVYFGSEISMQAEEISGLIIAGESKSTFFLDTRAHGSQASTPSMSDLVPVFEIHSSSMIEDSDAEEMESAIVQNQDKMTYWTNFDSWIDYVTLLFWVGGIAMIGMGMVGAANAPTEEEPKDVPAASEEE
ncbi:MAG: hypothetical protein VXY10_01635 [Candidatus Thermoplasmatota archaeon]|nr:hypothetical protein [Candidatus Thermoplasmatota archaeon]